MKTICRSQTVTLPEGVTATVGKRQITVKGPKGSLTKDLSHLPVSIYFKEGDDKTIQVDRWFTQGKAAASIRTACSHITNMCIGVTKGYLYKMRFVYAHFPINVAVVNGGKKVEIRNFLCEKVVRVVDAREGVTVSRSTDTKDEIVLQGTDIDGVSRTAALIQQIS